MLCNNFDGASVRPVLAASRCQHEPLFQLAAMRVTGAAEMLLP